MYDFNGKNVFLSGPMTGVECNNIVAFTTAQKKLYELGARYVYSPAYEWMRELSVGCTTEKSHGHYMRKCVSELARGGTYPEDADFMYTEQPSFYDVLVSLDGWEGSEGSSLERTVAEACNIDVVYWDSEVRQ